MAKKPKSLNQWCIENNQTDILSELDTEENQKHYARDFIPDRIEYNSPYVINWVCEKGHKYSCEVVGRTQFGLKCPICNPADQTLPVGTKSGCLTIIGDFGVYQKEVAEPNIQNLLKEKEDFIKGIRKTNSNIDSADFFDRRIADFSNKQLYKCQCSCGRIHYMSQHNFIKSKHKYCTEGVTEKVLEQLAWSKHVRKQDFTEEELLEEFCGLAVKAWKNKQKSYKENGRRTKADNYDIDFTGRTFESLEILECLDDTYEEPTSHRDLKRKDAYKYTVYKLYKCRCYLCGREQTVKCDQFRISPPTSYGRRAYNGYWSGISCDCHDTSNSSFQWIVNKLLFENNINYRVEYSFEDLYGCSGINKLKFDFAILDSNQQVKCLIECQGEQHFMPVKEFGGNRQYAAQLKNDELKRAYAKEHNIELIEISYKDKQIEKVEAILREHKII